MNIVRSTTISVVLSARDIILALRADPGGCPVDILALPMTGAGVRIESAGGQAVHLTYVRKGEELGGQEPMRLLRGQG